MSVVNMTSGGLDSTLVEVLAREEKIQTFPLFIDYGQLAAEKEWSACCFVHKDLELPNPVKMDLSGFGCLIRSGLTDQTLDIKDDAFTPNRNFLFLLMGSAYAYQVGASAVSIGLLSEEFKLFPDQGLDFVNRAEDAIEASIGRRVKITVPLSGFSKADVIELSRQKGISGTYSCHTGNDNPCGDCIACREFQAD